MRIRKSGDRGYFDYDWLKVSYTFSYGEYQDQEHMQFHALRVLNENRIKPAVGFPVQSHKEMEMLTIVLDGGVSYQDDRGEGTILRPGDIHIASAGTGLTHTEINASDREEAHFLQIGILPDTKRLEPMSREKNFQESFLSNQWCLIASPDESESSLKIYQNVRVYMAYLKEGQTLQRDFAEGKAGWLQLAEGDVYLDEKLLEKGDGVALTALSSLTITSASPEAKVVFFEFL